MEEIDGNQGGENEIDQRNKRRNKRVSLLLTFGDCGEESTVTQLSIDSLFPEDEGSKSRCGGMRKKRVIA